MDIRITIDMRGIDICDFIESVDIDPGELIEQAIVEIIRDEIGEKFKRVMHGGMTVQSGDYTAEWR